MNELRKGDNAYTDPGGPPPKPSGMAEEEGWVVMSIQIKFEKKLLGTDEGRFFIGEEGRRIATEQFDRPYPE